MSDKLSGKVALVTGGSRGLGKAICVALAEHGATVAVNYANQESDAEQAVEHIRSLGGKAFAFRADVTIEDEIEGLIDEVVDQCGGTVDILVNNATGSRPMFSIEASTWQIYLDQLNYFVKAPLLLTKAVLPDMKSKNAGSIINIGSEVVQLGNANFSSYVTAKAAMIGMTRSWANELGPFGIRVNLLVPGFIHVERQDGLFDDYFLEVPLRRMGDVEEVGSAAVFLASDDSSFITGQCLVVNGGKTNSI